MPEPALDGRAMVGVVVAGWDSDRLLRSGISGTWAHWANRAPGRALDDGT
ncbi:hypothetical protein ACFWOX_01650 [Streptomyces sp. NPDC058467]